MDRRQPHGRPGLLHLTNNAKRGEDGQPVGGPNPREKNVYGQILRWRTDHDDHGANTFAWDLFVVAGNPRARRYAKGRLVEHHPQNMFNSPDGLGFDKAGRLWILTDGDSAMPATLPAWATTRCSAPTRRRVRFAASWSDRLGAK
jgi:secreted PhoX family phosphatase